MPQGNIFIRAKCDKPVYYVGETLNVLLDIDSRIHIGVRSIQAVLYITILLRCDLGIPKLIKERILQRTVDVPRKESLRPHEVIKSVLSLDLNREDFKMYTSRGTIINCSYSISATAYLDSACANPEPEIEIWADIIPKIKKSKHPQVNN